MTHPDPPSGRDDLVTKDFLRAELGQLRADLGLVMPAAQNVIVTTAFVLG